MLRIVKPVLRIVKPVLRLLGRRYNAASPINSLERPMETSKGKLLLCDDERLVLATLAEGLRRAGYAVLETDNGDDAILLAREHKPDLAVLDIRMHGKSGLDVAGYLRDHVGTPYIFLSACNDSDVIAQANELGALDFIVKPVAVRHLLPSIEVALARARLMRKEAVVVATGTYGNGNGNGNLRAEALPIAIGILMERYGIDAASAAARLGEWASHSKSSSADAAYKIVSQSDAMGYAKRVA